MDLVALGRRIADVRVQRGLTMNALAERAGVSASMLWSVERGRKAPTVVVLDRIATALGTPMSALLDADDVPRVIVRRAAEQDVAVAPDGWRRTILTPVVPGVNFEWVRTELPPRREALEYPAYAAGSHEYVVVETGRLRLALADDEHDLAAGDSIYFAADVPHAYANPWDESCSYHVAALIMRPRR
ncbi:helix-turn-helix domain-containing protein [Jiangella rhizosphaerae]|uniref:Helix-turn-helix domain-containing protein n=1 Tax=Jiangella rhizosphaerae TaxID=2293569 RepID=A0A418KLW7_9ACTN|nr:XRE family transcriptional regulator [Jiangella rhizosphaerae]RIQ18926.1 helix-turn-helix domain-containing protein [Jiangella rhizosphaerae]